MVLFVGNTDIIIYGTTDKMVAPSGEKIEILYNYSRNPGFK
jgi:hypothetical protein